MLDAIQEEVAEWLHEVNEEIIKNDTHFTYYQGAYDALLGVLYLISLYEPKGEPCLQTMN